MKGELLDIKGAALHLAKTEKALRNCVGRGTIPFRRIGSRIYFSKDELCEWWETLPGCDVQTALENLRKRNGDD